MQITERPSGLLVAGRYEPEGDAVAVQRLLREHDSRLRLVPQPDEARRCLLWQVFAYNGPDRDADYICSWMDQYGEPLPLSAELVEKVKLLDGRTRSEAPDANKMNEQHLETVRKDRRNKLDAAADDHKPYIDRKRVSVSMGPRPTMHDRL